MGTVLAATGAGSLASGLGSAVGVSGNIGVTDRARHEQKPDGGYTSHTEKVHGFAGGVDIAGATLHVFKGEVVRSFKRSAPFHKRQC